VGLFSCNNDEIESPSSDELTLEKSAAITVAEVQMEATSTESTYEVEFFANAEETLTRWWKIGKKFTWQSKLRYLKNCPDVTIVEGDNDGYPKEITLDYGDSTVLNNGKVLSGVIVIELSAAKSSQDYVRTVTYTDFGMDSVVVNGTSIVEVDKVDEMFRKFTSSLTFTFLADGTEIVRESERIWQWIAGLDTEDDQTDDIITISGTAYASMNGETYQKEITTPLKRLGDCKYIVEGVVSITLNGDVICTMDYGDGSCDEIAVMTNADGETEVDLSEHKMKGNEEQNQNTNQNSNGSGNGGGNGNG
jgi:hypothetical protein